MQPTYFDSFSSFRQFLFEAKRQLFQKDKWSPAESFFLQSCAPIGESATELNYQEVFAKAVQKAKDVDVKKIIDSLSSRRLSTISLASETSSQATSSSEGNKSGSSSSSNEEVRLQARKVQQGARRKSLAPEEEKQGGGQAPPSWEFLSPKTLFQAAEGISIVKKQFPQAYKRVVSEQEDALLDKVVLADLAVQAATPLKEAITGIQGEKLQTALEKIAKILFSQGLKQIPVEEISYEEIYALFPLQDDAQFLELIRKTKLLIKENNGLSGEYTKTLLSQIAIAVPTIQAADFLSWKGALQRCLCPAALRKLLSSQENDRNAWILYLVCRYAIYGPIGLFSR